MRTYPECMSCFLRQALDAVRISSGSETTETNVIKEVLKILCASPMDLSPPEIARQVYSTVREHTGVQDPYKEVKRLSNEEALKLYTSIKEIVANAKDPLNKALRFAVAGNAIDHGVSGEIDIERELEECLDKDFIFFDWDDFRKSVDNASNVLYVLDNAGEIVFDRLLVEQLEADVVCAVRERPIINDVTVEDAVQAGLHDVAKVISSGSDIPGTVLREADEEFRELYFTSDLVISKGQGNFETLFPAEREVFFILKAKCPVIARHLNCEVGDIVLKKS